MGLYREWIIKAVPWSNLNWRISTSKVIPGSLDTTTCFTCSAAISQLPCLNWQKDKNFNLIHHFQMCSKHSWLEEKKVNKKLLHKFQWGNAPVQTIDSPENKVFSKNAPSVYFWVCFLGENLAFLIYFYIYTHTLWSDGFYLWAQKATLHPQLNTESTKPETTKLSSCFFRFAWREFNSVHRVS